MPNTYVRYEHVNGYIHNWLVAGLQSIPILDLDRFIGEDWKLQIARHYYEADSGVTHMPVENEPFEVGEAKLEWKYTRCGDDHFVDNTAFYHTCHYLRAWAYCQVVNPSVQDATCVLTTNGPADVWLNGQHVHRQEHFHHQIPHRVSFQARLAQGTNEFLVRFEEVAARECPFVMALRIVGLSPEAYVFLPTLHEDVARRQVVENAIKSAYLDKDVFVWDDAITVHWPKDLAVPSPLTLRLQRLPAWIYSEARLTVSADHRHTLGRPYQVPESSYQVVLMPTLEEYYEGNLRLERKIAMTSLRNKYTQSPDGTLDERRTEALLDAARRDADHNVFSEIAKMALGYWADVKTDIIMETIAGINQRKDCSDFYLVGLLGMLHRYGGEPSFPESLKQPLEECVLNFKYWMDEPGGDAMCYWSENHQILFHTCEILAGQLYPERIFSNVGQTGQWHREKGERMALSWLLKRGAGGFREWGSNCYFEEDLLALSHLADLAESQAVYDLATVIMDKMFFTMALNSYKGTYGSTHGRTYTPFIKGGRQEPTAGVSRLMWGMGAYNNHILATVSLACMEDYRFPIILGDIAADLTAEMWNREHHAGQLEEWCDREAGDWEVNLVTYKTPDYMLSSVQDYSPGESGYQQHIWQATLGPDAVVFVTHPPCLSEEGAHRPNFWHGNVVLPRVAQWKDVLIAIHKLPDDDWLGFTHAYFPVTGMDEFEIHDRWAFGKVNDGYIALGAANGLDFQEQGDNAYRDLRSTGTPNVWLCQMGRAALDGTFQEFIAKVTALPVQFASSIVEFTTLRGDHLAFGWQGPFTINGEIEPLAGFKHYDNPYCSCEIDAPVMEIQYGGDILRLHLRENPYE